MNTRRKFSFPRKPSIITVIGASGAGKSTFAQKLGLLGYPIIEEDIFFCDCWVQKSDLADYTIGVTLRIALGVGFAQKPPVLVGWFNPLRVNNHILRKDFSSVTVVAITCSEKTLRDRLAARNNELLYTPLEVERHVRTNDFLQCQAALNQDWIWIKSDEISFEELDASIQKALTATR